MTRVFHIAAWLLCVVQLAFAQPETISYQGVLSQPGGVRAPDGAYEITFGLYTQPTGSQAQWAETLSVPVLDGFFSVVLGETNPIDLNFTQQFWMAMRVNGSPELTPRIKLNATPYSFSANTVADSGVVGRTIAKGHVVRSINSLTDNVTLAGGQNITIEQNGNTLTITGGGGVVSINGLQDQITIQTEGGATVSQDGNTITITAGPGGGTGVLGLQNQDNTLTIENPNGPTTNINVTDGGLTAAKIGVGQVVKSINSLKDDVTLAAGANVTLTTDQNTVAISSNGGTLDSSYDAGGPGAGATITADAGAVTINGTGGLSVSGGDIKVSQNDSYIVGLHSALWWSNNGSIGVGSTGLASLGLYAGSSSPRVFIDRTTGAVDISGNLNTTGRVGSATGFGFPDGTIQTTAYVVNDVADSVRLVSDGSITITANAQSHQIQLSALQASSRRFKSNIRAIDNAVATVNQLRGVEYDWREDGRHDIGLIAEEVGEVLPEVVEYEENGVDAKGLHYSKLVPLLIEAIKEQQEQIRSLSDEVNVLKRELQTK